MNHEFALRPARPKLLEMGQFLGRDFVQLIHASGDGSGTTVHVVGSANAFSAQADEGFANLRLDSLGTVALNS